MYVNGHFNFYRLQFFGNTSQRWGYLDIGHALFEHLPFEERRGPKGEEYRKLIDPIHDAWQECGEHAYFNKEDADKVLSVLKEIRPDLVLRIVLITQSRRTEVIV